jgi:hypothetical protein
MGGWDWQCLEVPQRPVQDEHRSKSCFDRHKNCEFWMTVKPPSLPTPPHPTPPHPTPCSSVRPTLAPSPTATHRRSPMRCRTATAQVTRTTCTSCAADRAARVELSNRASPPTRRMHACHSCRRVKPRARGVVHAAAHGGVEWARRLQSSSWPNPGNLAQAPPLMAPEPARI